MTRDLTLDLTLENPLLGKLLLPSNDVYEGEFKDGLFDGHGTYNVRLIRLY
mgnify:CR=1 FL=1